VRCKRKALSKLEGLLKIVCLEVMAEGIRAGKYLEGKRKRIPDCRSCNDKTGSAKQCGQMGWKAIGI